MANQRKRNELNGKKKKEYLCLSKGNKKKLNSCVNFWCACVCGGSETAPAFRESTKMSLRMTMKLTKCENKRWKNNNDVMQNSTPLNRALIITTKLYKSSAIYLVG